MADQQNLLLFDSWIRS